MLIPADFFTQERTESDMYVLRLYYALCDELELTDDPKVCETFIRLSRLAGKPIFLKESVLLAKFINKKISQGDNKSREDQGTDFFKKVF